MLACFKSILKIWHSTYLYLCSNLPMKFAVFLKISLLFRLFCLLTKIYGSITWELQQLWMRKFQCLLFVLKGSYLCYYIICMAVPLKLKKLKIIFAVCLRRNKPFKQKKKNEKIKKKVLINFTLCMKHFWIISE